MPMTISELNQLAAQIGWKLTVSECQNWIEGFWETKRYRTADGEPGIRICLSLRDEGTLVFIAAPTAYSLQGCAHRGAAIEAMSRIAYVTPCIGYELDPSDDEVRVTAEFPIGSVALTVDQLEGTVVLMVRMIDDFDPVVRHAMASGTVDLGLQGKPLPRERSEVKELVRQLGGMEKLRELAARRSRPAAG